MNLSFPSIGSLTTLGVLFALLPGLLTHVVVHALGARDRQLETISAILHGLAYTLLVHAVWWILTVKTWFPTPDIVGLPLCAIAVGLGVAWLRNSGRLFDNLRHLGFTNESAWHSTWDTAFRYARQKDAFSYTVIHLKDDKKLMGIVAGFSGEQAGGHVSIYNASWLNKKNEVASAADGLVLIPGELIDYVQFLVEGESNGKRESTNPTTKGVHDNKRTRLQGRVDTASEDAPAPSTSATTPTTER